MEDKNPENPNQDTARFEEVQGELEEPLGGVESLSAVIGIPEWCKERLVLETNSPISCSASH